MIITGSVAKIQQFKKFAFVILRSEGRFIQVVCQGKLDFSEESYIRITGEIQRLPEGKFSDQDYEIHASKIEVLSHAKPGFSSVCPDTAGPELQLEKRHLWLRQPRFMEMTILHSVLLRAIRAYFESTGLMEITPPSFVGTQCEGGATLFKLEVPARDHGMIPAYLTQSSQFYLEMALPAIGECFCIAPSFRAEKSHTRRHLIEFTHAECEWKDIFTLEDHMEKLKWMLSGIIAQFLTLGRDLLKKMELLERVERLYEMCKDILILPHSEAIAYCREHEIYADEETKTHFGPRDDIPEAQERRMIDQIGKIVFLTKFPKEFKSFYMATDKEDPSLTWGVDVEVPGVGEIIGSGVREGDYERLVQRIKEEALKLEDYKEYLELREYGFCRTSGMGLGVGRMLTWLTGEDSIRKVTTFPRFPGYLHP